MAIATTLLILNDRCLSGTQNHQKMTTRNSASFFHCTELDDFTLMCEGSNNSKWGALADKAWVLIYILDYELTPTDQQSMEEQFDYQKELCNQIEEYCDQGKSTIIFSEISRCRELITTESERRTKLLGSNVSSEKWIKEQVRVWENISALLDSLDQL